MSKIQTDFIMSPVGQTDIAREHYYEHLRSHQYACKQNREVREARGWQQQC